MMTEGSPLYMPWPQALAPKPEKPLPKTESKPDKGKPGKLEKGSKPTEPKESTPKESKPSGALLEQWEQHWHGPALGVDAAEGRCCVEESSIHGAAAASDKEKDTGVEDNHAEMRAEYNAACRQAVEEYLLDGSEGPGEAKLAADASFEGVGATESYKASDTEHMAAQLQTAATKIEKLVGRNDELSRRAAMLLSRNVD